MTEIRYTGWSGHASTRKRYVLKVVGEVVKETENQVVVRGVISSPAAPDIRATTTIRKSVIITWREV